MFIFIVFSVAYCFLIILFTYGWLKLKKFKPNYKTKYNFLTVIIAYKNEERNLEKLILNLVSQKYPKKYFEIILVNDNSIDNSYKIVKKYLSLYKNIKNLKLKNTKGKKNAINKGIKNAKGSLIITTDADCIHNKLWLKTINKFYNKTKAKLIICPVLYKNNKKLLSFANLQVLEFFSLTASTAGSAAINKPIMCNGANLAFEKKVYFEFSDPAKKDIISGDDTFLMFNILKKYKKSIKYLKNFDAAVFTYPSETLKKFYNQRIRWSSKIKYYNNIFVLFTGVIILFFNLLLFLSFWLGTFSIIAIKIFLIIFSLKLIIDFPLLFSVSKFFRNSKIMLLYPITQFFYFHYIIIIGFLSIFDKYKWK